MTEIFVLLIVVIGLAIFGIWRVRRVGSGDDPDRAVQGLPDDLRDKGAYPEDAASDPLWSGVPQQRRASRESGHGKDGGV